jgi:hypothetical protein
MSAGQTEPPAAEPRIPRAWLLGAGLVALAGVLARWRAAQGELWLDEIWSVHLAMEAETPLGVFTRLHHDNNHHLNTLWFMLLGDGHRSLLHRIPALLASLGAVALVARGPIPGGAAARPLAVVAFSWSWFLVHYGSEGRGYALLMLFALAAYQALERLLATGRRKWAVAFAVAGLLALLSHLTFAFVLAGLYAWAGLALLRGRGQAPAASALRSPATLALLALPGAGLVAIWAVDVRHLLIGGGPDYAVLEVLRELGRTAFAVPEGPAVLLLIALVAAMVFEVAAMARAREPQWAFWAVALVLAPAVLLTVRRPVFLAARYFSFAVPFVLLLVSAFLARCVRSGRIGRVAVALLTLSFVVASTGPIARLMVDGRGHYREAIAFLAANTAGPVISVGGDNDFRDSTVLHYYENAAAPKEVDYVTAGHWTATAPCWLLRHQAALGVRSPQALSGVNGRMYVLAGVFPYAGVSGWAWEVYRLAEGDSTPVAAAVVSETATP